MTFSEFMIQTYFDNTIAKYLLFLGISGLAFILGKIVYWIFENIVKKVTAKSKTKLDDLLIDLLQKPVMFYIVLFGINIAWNFLTFPNYPKIPTYFGNIMYMLFVLNACWLVARVLNGIMDNYLKPLAKKSETDLDDHLLPIVSKLINIIVFAVGIIMILQHFGQEIGPMLAGLGIGGIAFALAAKDLLSNLFGSVTVLFDKPFAIGERIKVGGYDGKVKEINLRTTKIETLEGTMIYVPNAQFTSDIVENVTQEWARKIKMTIGLVYDTDAKGMQKGIDVIKKILVKQEGVDNDKIMVVFNEFGAYSKDILVVYWITDKDNIFDIKNDVNFEIMKQFEKAKLEMAFPTQTVEIKK